MIMVFKSVGRAGRSVMLTLWVATWLTACGGGGGGGQDMPAAQAQPDEATAQGPGGMHEMPSQATRYVSALMAKDPQQAEQREPEDLPVAMAEDDAAEPDALN